MLWKTIELYKYGFNRLMSPTVDSLIDVGSHFDLLVIFLFVKLLIPKLLTMSSAKAVQGRISWDIASCFSLLVRANTLVLHHFLFLDKNDTRCQDWTMDVIFPGCLTVSWDFYFWTAEANRKSARWQVHDILLVFQLLMSLNPITRHTF